MTLTYFEEDAESFDRPEPIPVGVMMNWAGALVSFALMTGLGVWGYQLLVRDVTGVPVVRALEEPMRVAPDDPGGTRAEYQGLSVTQVAVEGAEEVPIDRVVLAPPPVQLADEDQAMAALLPGTPAAPTGPEPAAEPKSAIELAIAEALGATEGAGASELAADAVAPIDGARVRIIPASAGGVVTSPRPPARPVAAAAEIENVTPVAALPGGEVDADSVAPGTRMVQLGAFPSAEEARDAWDEMAGRLGDVLNGKARVIQEASAGGTTFYRLRALGFSDLSDARRFCAVLIVEKSNCIPVIRR